MKLYVVAFQETGWEASGWGIVGVFETKERAIEAGLNYDPDELIEESYLIYITEVDEGCTYQYVDNGAQVVCGITEEYHYDLDHPDKPKRTRRKTVYPKSIAPMSRFYCEQEMIYDADGCHWQTTDFVIQNVKDYL